MREKEDEWVGIVYKEDIMNVIITLLLGAFMTGLVDGLTEDIFLEAFIWAGIFTFTMVLCFYFIFHNKRIVLGLILVLYGAFIGLMQVVFFFIYGVMRQFPQGALMGKLWIIPSVVFPLNVFWLSVVIGFVMLMAGWLLVRSTK